MGEDTGKADGMNLRDILILVVDEDYISQTVIAGILKSCKYNVETVRNGGEALSTLRSRKDRKFDLVVADIHMPDMSGFELLKRISTEFLIPIVMMSADDNEQTMVKGLECGAVYFMRKPVRPDDLKNVWQYAIPKRNQEPSSQIVIEESNALGSHGSSSGQDAGSFHFAQIMSQGPVPAEEDICSTVAVPDKYSEESRPKRKLSNCKQKVKNTSEAQNNYPEASFAKKQKVAWSTELHNKFLDALKIIGLDRAVPKKILEVMNVPVLTRENVASHLQKYRIFLKRVADVTERPDGMGISNRTCRSNFSSSYLPLYYRFQLEHLEISDENLLRKRLKQELRAIRDPLYRVPSWRHSNKSGTSSSPSPFTSNFSSFALEPREYPNKQMSIVFGERLMGVGGVRGTNQLAFGSSSQSAPVSNNFNNASSNKDFIMDNTNEMVIGQQPSGMNMAGSELHPGALVNINGPHGATDLNPCYGMETENSRMMSQATFGNPTMQYHENAPSQPLEHGYMYDFSNNLDVSGFQADFSEFLIDQLDGGDRAIDCLAKVFTQEQAGSDVGYPYLNFSSYAAQAQQNNQESDPIPSQQFGEKSNLINTGNGDARYYVDDFYPWFDQEATQTQAEDERSNMVIDDELIGMYQGFQEEVVDTLHIGSFKRSNAS